METKKVSVSSKLVILILTIFVSYVIFLNLVCSVYANAVLYAILVVPVFAAVLLLSAKIKILPAPFAIMVFIMAFLMKGIFAVMIDTQPISDFNTFYKYAINLIQGNKSFGQLFYFKTWAYQTGPVIYYSAIMKLFGTGLLPLKLVNCFFMAGSNMLVYLIARKVSNDFTARFVSILYLVYPAPYFLTPVLTNQHFAACMFLAGIYVLMLDSMNMILRGILAGLLMSVGNGVRPLGLLIIIAVVVWSLIEAASFKKTATLVMTAVLLVVYLLGCFGLSAAVRRAEINPEGLRNNFPLWKFVIGFNQNSKGQFNYDDQNNIFLIKDSAKRNSVALDTIKKRISIEPYKMVAFIGTKINVMWAEFDTMMWGFYETEDGKLKASKEIQKIEPIVLGIEKIFYLLVFILLLMGLIRSLTSRRIRSELLLTALALLCFFGVHILIEIQVRYRYFAVMLVFIIAAKGSEILFAPFKNYKNNL
ncbi:MAG: hypothetical protein K0R50_3149 [Eubacterium sp.]|jgi:hypothetical protein|nr:hypothetical protein [Eubacterium sp.]